MTAGTSHSSSALPRMAAVRNTVRHYSTCIKEIEETAIEDSAVASGGIQKAKD